jgi:hypothetical protein
VLSIARSLQRYGRPRERRERLREPLDRLCRHVCIVSEVDEDSGQRQLNIHLDPEHLAGVYSNFANITYSDYEFTITFARIDHEVEEGDIPGVVVTRVNMAPKFMRELLDAMNDSWSKYQTVQGIKNLPEQSRPDDS